MPSRWTREEDAIALYAVERPRKFEILKTPRWLSRHEMLGKHEKAIEESWAGRRGAPPDASLLTDEWVYMICLFSPPFHSEVSSDLP